LGPSAFCVAFLKLVEVEDAVGVPVIVGV